MTQKQRDFFIAPLCEAGLLLVAGLASWSTRTPLFFASLGPTAYELTETPERASARPYNIIVGHLIGVGSGFAALWLTRAWYAPVVSMHGVSMLRVWAAVVATLLTVFGTFVVKATQPAALSTTLLVTTGTMQQPVDAPIIMAAILLVTALGEPLRRWRLGHRRRAEEERLAAAPCDKVPVLSVGVGRGHGAEQTTVRKAADSLRE